MNIIFTENMSKCRRTIFNAHQYSIPGTPNSMKCNAMYELTLHCIALDHKKSRPSWLLAARVARSSLKPVCGIGGQPLLLWEICFHFPRNQLFQFDKRALSHFNSAILMCRVILAVQTESVYSSICGIVPHSLSESLSQFWFLTLKSDPRDLWPLKHLIRVMRKHDLTNILTIFCWQFWQFSKFDIFWQLFLQL